jgi:hypothetical protein
VLGFALGHKHAYFHDENVVTDKLAFHEHVYEFYRKLLGSKAPRFAGLAQDTWGNSAHVV